MPESPPRRTWVRKHACETERNGHQCIGDEEILTHHTKRRGHYNNAPRPHVEGETEVSVQRGKLAVAAASAQRSLWAYVPAAPDVAKVIEDERQFETEAEFNDFLDSCFARHEAVFAAAENFVITTKSDGILIPPVRNALITVGTQWYLERGAALNAERQKELAAAGTRADSEELVRTAQGAISGLLD